MQITEMLNNNNIENNNILEYLFFYVNIHLKSPVG